MLEQNKSPNFPALLQPIWRSDIVEMNAPDKHTANMRRPAGPVLSPLKIPRDQEKGLTCGYQRQKQAKSKILMKTIGIQCWKQQKNPLYIFFG